MLGSHTVYGSKSCRKSGAGLKKVVKHKGLTGMDARVFVNKDSPDYRPSCGNQFTKRQQMSLNEEIPLDQVRVNEITVRFPFCCRDAADRKLWG